MTAYFESSLSDIMTAVLCTQLVSGSVNDIFNQSINQNIDIKHLPAAVAKYCAGAKIK